MTNQHTDEMRCSFCGGGDNPHPNVPDRRVCICRRVPKDIIRYQDALRVALAALKSGNHSHKIGAINAISKVLGDK